ncbi:Protoglobin-domain-containing protein [Lentinula raphanica]|uniref:Protoglobin-domain-containing protein n=1 Tax=Lentinula raphanica TaxID=153919 RepID=A0AA38P9P1_9AGAR|nr:Protoglobin-domain-containing protein [Lentinula raphanica]KAJ3838912.1 Protoglobin-domain-containing protein [Lentinula raphanica]KAJ3971743.1 Protoglobin-domain-containing protein [Lentinula raphanica]
MNGDADKESESQRTPHADKPPSECPFPHEPTDPNNTCPISPALFDPLNPPTQEISPELLRTSLHDRINYLKDFILFRKADQDILHKVAPLVNDLIPQVVDELYSKLFEFDVTKQIFLQRNEGFDGPLPSKLEDLTLSSPQLIYRKIFMKSWARRVLTSDYSDPAGKTWAYMDKVGIMHTGVKAFKHREGVKPLVVPYRDCALSLGWVQTVLQTAILRLGTDLDKSGEGEEGDADEERKMETLSMEEKISAVAAVSKVIWIQNDLFARHYIDE